MVAKRKMSAGKSHMTKSIRPDFKGGVNKTTTKSLLPVNYASKTDRGLVRENNEDRCFCSGKDGLFMIADGVGGHRAGEVASMSATKYISEFLKGRNISRLSSLNHTSSYSSFNADKESISKILNDALRLANENINSKSENDSRLRGMGATIILTLISNDNDFYVINLGDSRAYLISNDNSTIDNNEGQKRQEKDDGRYNIIQLSEDHSLVAEMARKGYITEEEARTHPLKNRITQYLGMDSDPMPFIKRLVWKKGDYLLLCSDGLTDMLDKKEICSTIFKKHQNENEKKMTDKNGFLQKSCEELVRKANEKGGKDNVTVILVQNIGIDRVGRTIETKNPENEERATPATISAVEKTTHPKSKREDTFEEIK
jgi:protein phosphatase